MLGDTRVPPDVLFDVSDPGTPGPPADAFDVQFRVPISFSMYVTDLAASGRERELAAVQAAYQRVVDETFANVQLEGGYVPHPAGGPAEARLALAVLVEARVPGIDGLRPHAHVYVGRGAVDVHDSPRVVDFAWLRDAVFNVTWSFYLRRLRAYTEELGLTWARPRPGAVREVVDPPYAEHIAGEPHGVCPGPWGPRELLLADADYLRDAADAERHIAWQRANNVPGAGPWDHEVDPNGFGPRR